MQIQSPPGYGPVVPLDREKHRKLGLRKSANYRWARELAAGFVNVVEFSQASKHYPVAFIRNPVGDGFLPAAIMSLKNGVNLFISPRGTWKKYTYVPAYFRRHPFCIAEWQDEEKNTKQIVCVDETALSKDGKALFDKDGEPTELWQSRLRLIEAAETARKQTLMFVDKLVELDLLDEFDALAVPEKGQHERLKGLFRVDEKRLRAVGEADLHALLDSGYMMAIYAHLMSLDNFALLLDMQRNLKTPTTEPTA